ncbi:MAG: hypothetical protein AAF587_22830 [Bacteroidota bacterium]
MIIPPKHLAHQFGKSNSGEGVYLKSNHLCFGQEVVEQVFQDQLNAYMAVYPEKGYLILSSISHPFFKKLHDASQHMLKMRNSSAERSIALHELLIDHDLNLAEGPLKYEIKQSSNILKVYLS